MRIHTRTMRWMATAASSAGAAVAMSVAMSVAMAGVLVGCDARPAVVRPPSSGQGGRVALLLPHAGADRYEAMDQPYFELRLKRLCPACVVDYRNAANSQDTQNQQVQDVLDKGANVLVVDAVDSKHASGMVDLAKRRHVPVISYDRLILGSALDYYISFDNVKVGRLAGTALLDALGSKAATGKILWINGPPADNNSVLYKQGAHQVLDGKVRVAAEFTMVGPGYDPAAVAAWLKQVVQPGTAKSIIGAYCVDDNSAGLVYAALTAAGVTTIPPITGHNADIAGMRRMLVGQQYMTVYKPFQTEAEKAADIAYSLLRGEHPPAQTTIDNQAGQQPTFLLEPQTVTKDNLKTTVLKDGFVTIGALCAAAYTEACHAAGIA